MNENEVFMILQTMIIAFGMMAARLTASHVVVLSHGLLGNERELCYLERNLINHGVLVFSSQSNRFHRTLEGIDIGGQRLAHEVTNYIATLREPIDSISFVGNSLGGLYSRYAISKLYDEKTKLIAGLRPNRFMTIATPHLGVMNHTFLDDHKFFGRYDLRKMKFWISRVLLKTGRELFMVDHPEIEETLLFRMAADEKFLRPLKAFEKRRAYANLRQDFMVPLGTAAFMSEDLVNHFRSKFINRTGILDIIASNKNADSLLNSCCHSMINNLDSCGWDKVLVHFNDLVPLAHNKISALCKYGSMLDNWLGFTEGTFVIDDAVKWLVT